MTTTVVFWTIAVPLITFAVVGLCWLISRARAADAERNRFLFGPARRPGMPYLAARWDDDAEQWVNEEPHDVGPDALQLLQDTDTWLNAQTAEDAELASAFGAGAPVPDLGDHPDSDAGWERLRQAIRDEQQKGDTA